MISRVNAPTRYRVSQRSDLTFKDNIGQGRHGWLRLTPAYSANIVRDVLAGRGDHLRVLDPFSGTGTTALCAAELGHRAAAMEINPFLVWLSRVKTAIYRQDDLRDLADIAEGICSLARDINCRHVSPPPISNIHRWWDEDQLSYL